jgi:hypothetical protein
LTSTRRVGSDRQGFNSQLRVILKSKVVSTAITVTEGESIFFPPRSPSYYATASVCQCACMYVASNHTTRVGVQNQVEHRAPTKMVRQQIQFAVNCYSHTGRYHKTTRSLIGAHKRHMQALPWSHTTTSTHRTTTSTSLNQKTSRGRLPRHQQLVGSTSN